MSSKLSKRLLQLANFVSAEDRIVDVGCDHGLLSIYLIKNKICNKVMASDINNNALKSAVSNISKSGFDIPVFLSDGISDVPMSDVNSLIISGMGTHTILHILENINDYPEVKKIIIQTNNNHNLLRRKMNKLGFYLLDETYIQEKNKWYVTSLFVKSCKKNTIKEIEFGVLNNKDYVEYLLKKDLVIIKKIPETNSEKELLKNKIEVLKSYL